MNDGVQRGTELLAVVEVDKSDRVACQAPGCGRAVYKRIHIVRGGGVASLYGSDCFERLFLGLIPDIGPRYGNSDGRLLTAEERAMLVENTERLLAQFEAVRADALEKQGLRWEQQELLEKAAAERVEKARREAALRRAPSATEIASVELKAKRIVRAKFQVDPDQPGWRGLVLVEAWKLLDR